MSHQRILFPIDFSNFPFAVPPAIRELVDQGRTEVVVLHVVDARRSRQSKIEYGMRELDLLARRHFGKSAVTSRVEHGTPGSRILDYIRNNEVDLVVMPARDSGGFGKGPLGRVASEVLSEAPCPVWLEWRSGNGDAGRDGNPGVGAPSRICCAIDGAQSAEQVIRDSVEIADRLSADLTIISCVQPQPNHTFTSLRNPSVNDREVIRETERVEMLRRKWAPGAEVVVAVGWREVVIGRTVRDRRASLLITGDCRQAVLAAEGACPVLRLALHTVSTRRFRAENLVEIPQYSRRTA